MLRGESEHRLPAQPRNYLQLASACKKENVIGVSQGILTRIKGRSMPSSTQPVPNKLNDIFGDFCLILLCLDIFCLTSFLLVYYNFYFSGFR